MKKCYLTCLALLAFVVLVACGQSKSTSLLDKIKDSGQLVVATSPDYAPFEFTTLVDGKNTVLGSDIQLAQAIADELGVELVVSPMSFDNVLTSIKSGKADLAISALSYSAERAKAFDFSTAYYKADNAILIKSDQLDQMTSLTDLSGKKVAVQKGSLEEGLASDQLTDSQIVSLTLMGEAVKELKAGQVDALVMEAPVAEGYLAQNSDLILAGFSLTVSDDNAMSVVVPKGNDDLLALVNQVIEKVDYGEFIKTAKSALE